MIVMAVSSFPPEPSYISGKIVHVISEKTSKCYHKLSVCMIAMAASSFSPPKPINGKIIHVIIAIRFVDT